MPDIFPVTNFGQRISAAAVRSVLSLATGRSPDKEPMSRLQGSRVWLPSESG